jgi:hypothetical protein
MLSGQENPKVVAGWVELDYFRRPRRPRRLRFWAIALALVASIVVVVVFSLPRSRAVYQAAPLSTAHALFETSCEKCHVAKFQTARRLWSGNEAVRSVADEICMDCHKAPAHHDEAMQTLTCVACHREHRGRIKLAQVADGQCTFCHGDLRTKTGQPRFHKSIHAFADDHPDFAPRKNTAQIRFNHKRHLELHPDKARGFESAFKELKNKGCAYCHEQGQVASPLTPDAAGLKRERGGEEAFVTDLEQRYPSPINYDRHCAACHPLRAGLVGGAEKDSALEQPSKDFAGRTLAHPRPGETAQVVRDALRGRLLEVSARYPALAFTQAGSAVESGQRLARLPDWPLPQLAADRGEAWSEGQLHAIERELFDGAGGCRYCHIERSAVRPPGRLPDYAPPEIPTRWFTHGRFHHPAHRALTCTECHEMLTSSSTSDVRMPGITTCQNCHSPAAGVRSDCTLCHTYHDRSRYPSLDGKQTIEALTSNAPQKGPFYEEIVSWLKSIRP